MAGDVIIRTVNKDEVVRVIRKTETALGIPKITKIVGVEGVKGIQRHFIYEVSPEGVPWAKLKSREGSILRDKNVLFNSVTFLVSGSVVHIGTNDKRSFVHQFGAVIRSKKPGGYLALPVDGGSRLYRGPFRFTTAGDTFVIRLGGKDFGNDRLWLVRKNADGEFGRKNSYKVGEHGKLQFLALLVKAVMIPARPFVGMSGGTQDNIMARLEEIAKRSWADQSTFDGTSN